MSTNKYKFQINKGNDDKFYLICETVFEYKDKAYKIDNKRVIEDFQEGYKIDAATQQDAIREINEEINNFKLTN